MGSTRDNEALKHLKTAEEHMDAAIKEFAVVLFERCPGTSQVNELYLARAKRSLDKLYDARDQMRRL